MRRALFPALVVVGLVVACGGIPPVPPQTVAWGEAANVGGVTVRVKSATLGGFTATGPNGQVINSEGYGLRVVLAVEGTGRVGPVADAAELRDGLGNVHRIQFLRADSGQPCPTLDQLAGPVDVRPGQPVTDLLPFAKPADGAQTLTLTVPATAYGGSGRLAFSIPRTAWAKK